MEVRQMRRAFTCAIAAAIVLALPIDAVAQASALPRTADGKPNLQGIWQVLNSAAWDIQDHQARLGEPAGQGVVEGNELPYRPEALLHKRQNFENRATADPESKGYLPGVPPDYVHAVSVSDFPDSRFCGDGVRVRGRLSDRLHERDSTSQGPHQLLDGRLAGTLGGRHARRRCRSLH